MTWFAQDVQKVEVRFNGTSWTNVSAYVDMSQQMQIDRGRDDETGDPLNPGTLSVVLINDDGRFSPEMSGSPYYPYVVEGVAIRVSMYVNGSWVPRFYGTVQSWSVTLDSALANAAHCTVTASSSLAAFPSYTFRQASDEMFRHLNGIIHHWPLRDTSSPAQPLVGALALSDNGGEDGWGLGGLLPMDEGADQHVQMVSTSGKLGKLSVGGISTGTSWTVYLVLMSEPTANGTLLKLTTSGYGGFGPNATVGWSTADGITFSPSGTPAGKPSSYPALLRVQTNTSESTVAWSTANYDTYGATGWPLGSLTGINLNPTLSGGSTWGAAHLAVTNGATVPSWQEFSSWLLGPRNLPSAYANTKAPYVLTYWMNGPSISAPTLDAGELSLPQLEGKDAADVMATLVGSSGSRLVEDLDGTLTWVAFPPSSSAITLPVEKVDPEIEWETSDLGWYSDVTVTWPDGTSYTASREDGKRTSISIEGVHADRDADRSYADWLVNSPLKARVTSIKFEMSTLSAADQATLAAVTIGDRLTLGSLPSAILPASLTLIVEGIEDDIDSREWWLTFKTSPDVYSRLFILDDPVQSVLDAGYLLAP